MHVKGVLFLPWPPWKGHLLIPLYVIENHVPAIPMKNRSGCTHTDIHIYIYIQIPMALATLCIAGAELPKALVEQHVQ